MFKGFWKFATYYLDRFDNEQFSGRLEILETTILRKLDQIMATNAENKAALIELQALVTDLADDITKMDAKITELQQNPGDQETVDEIAAMLADTKQRLATAAGVFPKQEG